METEAPAAPAGRTTRGRAKAATKGKSRAKVAQTEAEQEPEAVEAAEPEAELAPKERGRGRGRAAKKAPASRDPAPAQAAPGAPPQEEAEGGGKVEGEAAARKPSARQARAGQRRTRAQIQARDLPAEEAEVGLPEETAAAPRATRRMTRARAQAETAPHPDAVGEDRGGDPAPRATRRMTRARAEQPQELERPVPAAAAAGPEAELEVPGAVETAARGAAAAARRRTRGAAEPASAPCPEGEAKAPSRRRTREQADLEPEVEAVPCEPDLPMKPAKQARRRRTRVDLMAAAAAIAAENEDGQPPTADEARAAVPAEASGSPNIPREAQPEPAKKPRRKTTHQTAAFNFQPEPATAARAAAAEAAAAVKKKPVTDLVEAALMDPGALLSSRGAAAKARAAELARTPGPTPAAGTAEKAGRISLTTPLTGSDAGATGGCKTGAKSVTPDEMAHSTMQNTELETRTVLDKARGGGLRNMADLLKPSSKAVRPHATPGPSPLVTNSSGTIKAPPSGHQRTGALRAGVTSTKAPFPLKGADHSSVKPGMKLAGDEGRRTPGVKASPAVAGAHALHREEVIKRKRALEEQQRGEWLRQQEEKRRRVEGNLAAMEAKDRARREARVLAERERKAAGAGAKTPGGVAKTPGRARATGAGDKENIANLPAANAAAKWTQGFGQGAPAPTKKAFPAVTKATSTPVTANTAAKAAAKAPVVESYDMSPYRGSDDEDEEEYAPKKVVPLWAQRQNLLQHIQRQAYTNPDKIFQTKQTSCCLDEVFGNGYKSRHWNKTRGSSGDWAADEVTAAEEMYYEKAMGFLSAR